MPDSCSAVGCKERNTPANCTTFHRFPKNDALRSEWVCAVNRLDVTNKSKMWRPGPFAVICSKHFKEEDFLSYGLTRKLKDGTVPSIFQHLSRADRPTLKRQSMTSQKAESPIEEIVEEQAAADPIHDHSYTLGTPEDAAKKLRHCQDKLQKVTGKLNAARRRMSLHKKKMSSLIDELANLRLLSSEAETNLRAQFTDLQWELVGDDVTKYTDEMKKFATTLHLYSAKAYDYVRKLLHLPHPSTLRRWLSSIDGSPGFSQQMFDTLKIKVDSGEDVYKYCSLMIDGMSIKKQVVWDPSSQQMMGFEDMGAGPQESDEVPIASEAIVIMAVGLLGNWKAPLGYFLCHSMTGAVQCQLVKQAISELYASGVTVLSVTSDATAYNIQMARLLGVVVNGIDDIQCAFPHPSDPSLQIVYFLDACHMLKLIRNALQHFRILKFHDDSVNWEYLVSLVKLQETEMLHAANKLTSRHIYFHNHKMKVNYAAQLFSHSVASALQFVNDLSLPQFHGCETTCMFLRLINNVFDVFNSRNIFGKGFKAPLKSSTFDDFHVLFTEYQTVLRALSDVSGCRIVSGRRKWGFLGLLLNFHSLFTLYRNFISSSDHPFKYFLTYKFSQDHLELFFGAVRQACGSNDNPSSVMLKAIYRQFLARCDVAPGQHGNVVTRDNTNLLDVTLVKLRDVTLRSVALDENVDIESVSLDHAYSNCGVGNVDSLSQRNLDVLSIFTENIVTYIAGFVIRRVLSSIHCETCRSALFSVSDIEPQHCSLINIKNTGSLYVPSESVRRILSIAEKVLRTHTALNSRHMTPGKWGVSLQIAILESLMSSNVLFPSLQEHLFQSNAIVENHYVVLLKEIVNSFLNVRSHHVAKTFSEQCCGKLIRKKLTKLIHFQNQ